MSVIVHLADDIDVSRGDVICRPHNHPEPVRELDAMICWMTDDAAASRARGWASSRRRATPA